MINLPKITQDNVHDLVTQNMKIWNDHVHLPRDLYIKFNFDWYYVTNPSSDYIYRFVHHLDKTFQLTSFYLYFTKLKNEKRT